MSRALEAWYHVDREAPRSSIFICGIAALRLRLVAVTDVPALPHSRQPSTRAQENLLGAPAA
jgi:hypothetical protein